MTAAANVRRIPDPSDKLVPDSRYQVANGKQGDPRQQPADGHRESRSHAESRGRGGLDQKQTGPAGRPGEQIAQGAEAGLAAMVSPATTETVSGRKKVMVTVSPANAANTPLCDTRSTNAGPLPAEGPPKAGWRPPEAQGWRTRPPGSLGFGCAEQGPQLADQHRRRSSVVDIEAFSGQGHVQVLEARSLDAQGPHRYAGQHQLAVALLWQLAVERAGEGTAASSRSKSGRPSRARTLRLRSRRLPQPASEAGRLGGVR